MYIFERTKTEITIVEVHEDEPNRTVAVLPVEKQSLAREIFRSLKRNGGFGGWTPAFMGVFSG